MPGELALGMILWEYQMHGWDLARATGQSWWRLPAAAAEESLGFAPEHAEPGTIRVRARRSARGSASRTRRRRSTGCSACRAATPPEAGPLTQLPSTPEDS